MGRRAEGPTQQARALYEHVERYLVGAMNEPSLEFWRLAVAKSIERGESFDAFLGRAAQAYLRSVR